jgi:pyridoxamine 5'-phosphate oxidase
MKSIKAHIRELRNEFTSDILDEKYVSKSPLLQFEKWLSESIEAKVYEPNAMTLATSAENGIVDARIVLLRNYDRKGFEFFTNYKSIKGREIRQNKKVCLNFFWPELQRQIRIRGTIEKLSSRISDQYFNSRPRPSQIAAWASYQSERLIDRMELENRFKAYELEFKEVKIPRPSHWGGFRIVPFYYEFWQGRANRLHDRIIYQPAKNGRWTIHRLNP